MRKLKTWELGRLSPEEYRMLPKLPIVVVLDDIRSAYNVGSVFRTADAFRVDKLFLCARTSRPDHVEIYKTALGAEDVVSWEYYENTLDCILHLKNEGYMLIGIEQTDSSLNLDTYNPQVGNKYALILGNEVEGVNLEVLKTCDVVLEIPQEGTKHSLNISVAAGVVMWEFFKKLK